MCRAALGIAICAAPAIAQFEVPDAHFVLVQSNIRLVGLSPAELRQVTSEIENTSFDTPGSWGDELRARHVSQGASDILVIRGSRLRATSRRIRLRSPWLTL